MVARLLERDVRGGVADEQRRDEQAEHSDRGAGGDQHVARGEVGCEPAARSGGQRDAAVAGGLVEPEREAAPPRTDEVDLHDHGHGPRQALVDAQQHVRGDDPAPARRRGDQQRDGEREHPAGDQQPAPPEPGGEAAGAQVRERLGQPERDDERQHRGLGRQAELLVADQRESRALQADHGPDERVERDQQRELRRVLAQPELDAAVVHRTPVSGRPARLAARISAWRSGAGGMS